MDLLSIRLPKIALAAVSMAAAASAIAAEEDAQAFCSTLDREGRR
jgi:hypothetical protein